MRRLWTILQRIRSAARLVLLHVLRALSLLDRLLWDAVWAGILLVAARLPQDRSGQRLYWGPAPLPHFQYISDALRAVGYRTTTVVQRQHQLFSGLDFDVYEDELVEASRLPNFIARRAAFYVVFLHSLRNYDIVHIPFTGGPLGRTRLAWLEPHLFRRAGIRTVLLPFGGDFWRFSWISEALMRHAMLLNYPEEGRREDLVERRVERWMRYADIVVCTTMIEGASRWDVMATDFNIVPPDRVRARTAWSTADGETEPVTVVHAPNHRGVKGTEFVLEAIDSLRSKGYAIDLVLLEGRPNEEVLEALRRADICIDHCIGSGWGLLAVEAMASGAAVMVNLDDEHRIGVHRHFGWLNQSPLVSANIEQLEETLEYLIRNPSFREELGRIGIEYVRRFHSPETAQYLFGSIYRRLRGEEVDLMRLFQPLSSEYMSRFEPLRPPLERNRPPALLPRRDTSTDQPRAPDLSAAWPPYSSSP
jgi:glycosyltransferase involved in cell wall biosynthesis